MKTLVFITNLIHHHQLPLADEFYKLFGDGYHYVSTEPMPEWLIKGGYDPNQDRPYIIRSFESKASLAYAKKLIDSADVVITGSNNTKWVRKRLFFNKMTFRFSERWFKDGDFSKYLKFGILLGIVKNHWIYRWSQNYLLCASAYAAEDVQKVFCYPKKCFKFGYFTKVDNISIDSIVEKFNLQSTVTMMWCSRFISWKHPELPVLLAHRLKEKGYKFTLDMFGSGELLEEIKKLSKKLGVDDVVTFCGNKPNKEILEAMKEHEIFLFTSDRNEGWGAVANEALSNGCILVGSDEIGSVPYLLINGVNGFVFKSGNLDSLSEVVESLLNNPNITEIAIEGYKTMINQWSPQNAAKQFVNLVNNIKNNENFVVNGPCSEA